MIYHCARCDRPADGHGPVCPTVSAPVADARVPEAQPGVTGTGRAGDAQDGRTTAEWIADLVKARQAAEAERDEALDRRQRAIDPIRKKDSGDPIAHTPARSTPADRSHNAYAVG